MYFDLDILYCSGFSSDIWTEVGGVLSAVTRVCIYDRSGIGFSDRPVIKPHITDSEGMHSTYFSPI